MSDSLFFIALLPNLEIQQEVTAFKNEAAKNFEASKALNSPPHITLQAPFRWGLRNLDVLKQSLLDFSNNQKKIFLHLDGFDCFRPKTIFVKVEPNDDLTRLQGELENYLATALGLEKRSQRNFHPHMTVAFRDLRREKFDNAWAYFSSLAYQRFFEADRLSLLQHNGKFWEIREKNLFRFKYGKVNK